jgi:dienelactone hydrolase
MTRIVVSPTSGLLDEPIGIRIVGVHAHARVRVRVRSEAMKAEASAEFIADEAGVVDLSLQAPVSGDYEGVEPAGLFWSARFDEGADLLGMLHALTRLEPLAYTATVEIDGAEVARAEFVRRLGGDGVVRTDVRHGRIRGTLFAPKGLSKAPGVIVLGGSDGGNNFTFIAALLAAHGFAALALAYFAYDDLPREFVELPLEYFGEAIEWLQNQASVEGRVGILGMSRGGELALLLGATYPQIAAVAALVPSGITMSAVGKDPATMMRAAWTFEGNPLPFLPPPFDPESMQLIQRAYKEGVPYASTPGFNRMIASQPALVEQAEIPVERTEGAILMTSAEDDGIWPCSALAEFAMKRLRTKGFALPFEHLRYPGAGHWACLPPNLPTSRNWSQHPQVPIPLAYGGTPRDTAAAAADAWPRVVRFLRHHLSASAINSE